MYCPPVGLGHESDSEVPGDDQADMRTCDTGFVNTDVHSDVSGSDSPLAQTGDKHTLIDVADEAGSKTCALTPAVRQSKRLRLGFIPTHSTCQSQPVTLSRSAQIWSHRF